eukprot:2683815-Rhodomonas_salina.9
MVASAISLRACHAMSGTDLAYAAICLPTPYVREHVVPARAQPAKSHVICTEEPTRPAPQYVPSLVPPYARATPCPSLPCPIRYAPTPALKSTAFVVHFVLSCVHLGLFRPCSAGSDSIAVAHPPSGSPPGSEPHAPSPDRVAAAGEFGLAIWTQASAVEIGLPSPNPALHAAQVRLGIEAPGHAQC